MDNIMKLLGDLRDALEKAIDITPPAFNDKYGHLLAEIDFVLYDWKAHGIVREITEE